MAGRYGESENGVTRFWNVERLWKLSEDLPVSQVPLAEIDAVEQVTWFDFWNPKPTVLEIIKHCERIQKADLSYPILLSETGRVFDGMHRIARAMLEGQTHISAKRFEQNPEPDEIVGGDGKRDLFELEIKAAKFNLDDQGTTVVNCLDQHDRYRADLRLMNEIAGEALVNLEHEPVQLVFPTHYLSVIQCALSAGQKIKVRVCPAGRGHLEVHAEKITR